MKKIIIFFLFLSIILTACSTNGNSIYVNNTCEVPCWFNIVPEETTDQRSIDLLRNNKMIEVPQEEIEYDKSSGRIDNFRFYYKNDSTFIGEIVFHQGVVNYINLYSKNWDIENIISYFGEPNYYFSSFQRYESTYRTVYLFYPNKGTIIVALPDQYNSQNDNSILSNNTKVINIYSFSKIDYSDELISIDLGDFQGKLAIVEKENIHPWIGIGELQTIKFP